MIAKCVESHMFQPPMEEDESMLDVDFTHETNILSRIRAALVAFVCHEKYVLHFYLSQALKLLTMLKCSRNKHFESLFITVSDLPFKPLSFLKFLLSLILEVSLSSEECRFHTRKKPKLRK